jgi:hypothetical protein
MTNSVELGAVQLSSNFEFGVGLEHEMSQRHRVSWAS